jgi:D-alanine-D-alanine ligase
MRKKITVAMLFGGRSVEHEISVRSARNVYANIDREQYDVLLVGIDKDGCWFLVDDLESPIRNGKPLSISLDPRNPAFRTGDASVALMPDVVFPVLHGTDGEDGSIQGLFTALGLPVVGSGVLGSSLSMDKVVSKQVLMAAGLPVASYLAFRQHQLGEIRFEKIVDELGLPFMVKSASLGSSVGVNKVKNREDFSRALEDSFRYDDKVVLEEYIQGREMECAVIGNEQPEATLPGEIRVGKHYEFYDYTAKYLDEDAVRIHIPAEVDTATANRIRDAAVMAYQALQCEDFARVDLFLCDDGRIYINEINTIPGFTNISMFPMLWKHMGLSYPQLISRLIDSARARWDKRRQRETSYTSNA